MMANAELASLAIAITELYLKRKTTRSPTKLIYHATRKQHYVVDLVKTLNGSRCMLPMPPSVGT